METLSNLGNALTKLQNYPDAWMAFDQAMKLNPSDPRLIENYLLCILESKDIKKFEYIYKNAKFLQPDILRRIKAISVEYKVALGMTDNKRKPHLRRSNSRASKVSALKRKNSLVNELLNKGKREPPTKTRTIFLDPDQEVIEEENEEF